MHCRRFQRYLDLRAILIGGSVGWPTHPDYTLALTVVHSTTNLYFKNRIPSAFVELACKGAKESSP